MARVTAGDALAAAGSAAEAFPPDCGAPSPLSGAAARVGTWRVSKATKGTASTRRGRATRRPRVQDRFIAFKFPAPPSSAAASASRAVVLCDPLVCILHVEARGVVRAALEAPPKRGACRSHRWL